VEDNSKKYTKRANLMEAERILNQHKFTVLWSGGKDSTAALLWVLDHIRHNNWNVLYVEITGNTHPKCTEYVARATRKLGIEDKLVVAKTADFYELMDKWGPPLMFAYRWCLYQLKAKAFEKAFSFTVDGVRRADSNARRKTQLVSVVKLSGKVTVSPLVDWTKEHVLDYIKSHGLDLNPCYKLYGHSGNCMFCPYANKTHIILTMNDPEWHAKILPVLVRHREKLAKGSIGRLIYNRWITGAMQSTITLHPYGGC
jgi:3'-phosphoadenosine 5'-phosphosulfate sulfotransferase (PAPS reductase)/FAD synthetase